MNEFQIPKPEGSHRCNISNPFFTYFYMSEIHHCYIQWFLYLLFVMIWYIHKKYWPFHKCFSELFFCVICNKFNFILFFFYSNVISFLQIILWRRLEMNQNHFLINESSNETKFKINCAFYFYTFLTFDNEHWIWFSDLNLLKNVVVKESSASRFHTAEMHIHSF